MRFSLDSMINLMPISAEIAAAVAREQLTVAQAAVRMGFNERITHDIINGVGLDRFDEVGLRRALADLMDDK